MKTHPMLFSGPMVRALLDGRKTQTRRVIKPQPVSQGIMEFGEAWAWSWPPKNDIGFCGVTADQICRHGAKSGMSKIQTGDMIWVRESYHPVIVGHPVALYRADNSIVYHDTGLSGQNLIYEKPKRWVPSIHMPKWASRITLEVTDVRVQRLRDINSDDAVSEGLKEACWEVNAPNTGVGEPDLLSLDGWSASRIDAFNYGVGQSPEEGFQILWNSINGSDAWDQNPWVVAYSFTVHQCNVNQIGETNGIR